MRLRTSLKLLLLIICISISIYMTKQKQTKTVNIYISNTLYYKDGILGLNIINSSESEATLTIVISNENNENIIPSIVLNSGEFVGNIPTLSVLPVGSQMYTVILTVNTQYKPTVEKRKVLIISEE